MTQRFALITGQGALVEEVRSLAENKYGQSCREYSIATIPPRFYSNSPVPLNMFRFDAIMKQVKADGFDRVFLAGGFAQGRDLRTWAAMHLPLFGPYLVGGDATFRRYYSAAPSKYLAQIRYLKALEAALKDNGIVPLYAREVFPELNLPLGDVGASATPPEAMALASHWLPHLSFRAQLQPSRTAVIDARGIREVIGRIGGTNSMIDKYGSRTAKSEPAFVLKMPSDLLGCALYEPTIGPETIHRCRKNGIHGLIVCASRVRIVSREHTIAEAKRMGLFLYGRGD